MSKKVKRIISLILISVFMLTALNTFAVENTTGGFNDVPEGHWAEKAVNDLRSLGITNGIGNNNFGLGLTIKRSEFAAYLVRLMQWELIKPEKGSFSDNMDSTKWYYSAVETALKNEVVSNEGGKYPPEVPITREEMAVMIVNALGCKSLAEQLENTGRPFDDVASNASYIAIARNFGIITGVGDNRFKPNDTATREQAAAMMMRMYDKLKKPMSELHAFYAISSYSQMGKINGLDSVSFGWSRLEYDIKSKQVVLNTTSSNNNEYSVPSGFSEPYNFAIQNKISTQLMIAVKNDIIASTDGGAGIPLQEYILTRPEIRKQVITSITGQINSTVKDGIAVSFDGVVIDFEEMKGDLLKKAFNMFLSELDQELDKASKKLCVAVHPKGKPGQAYYDAYDYRTIGEIADKVILMAHDYYARKLSDEEMQNGYTITPLTPVDQIYYALEAITDKTAGVQDLNKIWLQLSFDSVLWKLKDGTVINRYPYNPNYKAIQKRLLTDVSIKYGNSKNPYVEYFDNVDGTYNVLWYEDSRSVQEKIKLARMFGINGISLWRLGNIPDYADVGEKTVFLDVWQQLLSNYER